MSARFFPLFLWFLSSLPLLIGCDASAERANPPKPKIKSPLTFERSLVDSIAVGWQGGCLDWLDDYGSGDVVSSVDLTFFNPNGDTAVRHSLENFLDKYARDAGLLLIKKYYHYGRSDSTSRRTCLPRIEEFKGRSSAVNTITNGTMADGDKGTIEEIGRAKRRNVGSEGFEPPTLWV